MGLGPVSIAWGTVAGSAVTVCLLCLTRLSASVMAPSFRGWRAVLLFGGQSSFASSMPQLCGVGTQLLLGRLLGLGSVGFYNRAYNVIYNARGNILGSFYSVAFPHSRLGFAKVAISEKPTCGPVGLFQV